MLYPRLKYSENEHFYNVIISRMEKNSSSKLIVECHMIPNILKQQTQTYREKYWLEYFEHRNLYRILLFRCLWRLQENCAEKASVFTNTVDSDWNCVKVLLHTHIYYGKRLNNTCTPSYLVRNKCSSPLMCFYFDMLVMLFVPLKW